MEDTNIKKEIEINKRDRDFFAFEEKAEKIKEAYDNSYPNNEHPEKLEKEYSKLLIDNFKITKTDKGNIAKTLCGHKITEQRASNNELIGIHITLYGDYEKKTRDYINLTTFNKWYEKELKKFDTPPATPLNSDISTVKENISSVVFSIGGNDYCFSGLTGMKFTFKSTDNNGIKFDIERLGE